MRFVFDTNVLVSAGVFPGTVPYQAIQLAIASHQIVGSLDTTSELYDVLMRKKFDRFLPRTSRTKFFEWYLSNVKLMEPEMEIIACRDPDDDKFLSLAVVGKADAIVTGDADLLALHPFRGVAILTPQQFVEQFATG